ncbi:MAG TPA: DUF4410 domain-containing protein [Polyangiales bacterium]|nr:DUF4410 domain-containing protein [Polyangiales bacterium]
MTRYVLALIAAFVLACGGRTGSAPKNPDGSQLAVLLFTDRGIQPDMPPDRVQQIEQMAEWMENDLIAILAKTGYAATRVADGNTQAGPGRYVLKVTVKNYSAGSKAARMLVGFGAGGVVLDTHFELFGETPTPLVIGDPSVGSGRDWTNAARKVNLQTVDAVNARLHQPGG